MNLNDQYLSHAADRQLMACMTRDESERQTWLEMAKTWLQLVELPHAPTTPIDGFRLIRQDPPSRGRVRLPSFNSHAIKITWAPSGALSVCSCRRQEPFSASIRLADHSDGATGGKLSDSAARETSPVRTGR